MADETLLKKYHLFFPGDSYHSEDFDTAVDSGDIIIDPGKIVNLLQRKQTAWSCWLSLSIPRPNIWVSRIM